MDARKSHFMSLMWASLAIVVFVVVASIVAVSWSPMLSEAIAVEMNRDNFSAANTRNNFSSYIALHQTESWQRPAILGAPAMIADCPK